MPSYGIGEIELRRELDSLRGKFAQADRAVLLRLIEIAATDLVPNLHPQSVRAAEARVIWLELANAELALARGAVEVPG